ncbi:hypothetical protein TCAL_00978, partial [Tigriopus californicus]
TFVVIASLVICGALADNPPPSYKPQYPEAPAQYSFEWQVKDDYSKNDFGQNEERYGENTKGNTKG